MTTFTAAMDKATTATRALGENQSPELTAAGVGDPRVALFAGLVRGADVGRLVDACGDDHLVDVVLLAFNARDCRGGKGEKKLFYDMLFRLLARVPRTTTTVLLEHVPFYGYWKDLVTLYEAVDDAGTPSAARKYATDFKEAIVELLVARLRKDATATGEEKNTKVSLLAKYAPREGKKKGGRLASVLAKRLFPGEADAKKKYRQLVASLNAQNLKTSEVKMCGKRWAEIDIAGVPSLCLGRNRAAFLNEKVKRRKALQGGTLLEKTGDRFPDDEDRVACRVHVREALVAKKKKIKGKQLFPHDLVKAAAKANCCSSTLEHDLLEAQWRAVVDNVRTAVEEKKKTKNNDQTSSSGGLDLGKLVALVDVSGSMSGTPMDVAVALGLIVAEVAAPAFANRVLTFESTPRWHKVNPEQNLVEKVRDLQGAPWGGSTNFAAAVDLILEVCVAHELPPTEIPDLLVLSDMQFDSANHGNSWDTHYETLVGKFAEAGRRAVGEPWTPPTITFWNLRATKHGGYTVEAHRQGTRMLAGFSPAMLTLLLAGSALEEEEELVELVVEKDGSTTTTTVVVKKSGGPSPYTTMRKAIDDPRYDPIRLALNAATEGPFQTYSFVVPASPPTDDEDDDDLVMVDEGAA
eukprot:CAMPEP_0118919268 /NCGR_PEP_ID=MMETSP1166-20130328/18457_1 /TAXON_ID=1104430 /ORGANISM="Chrysoreinhardia sp, Strain CCMP3193" /LENGTH=634 /DNA_ID=CAMNT_0006859791 /DNA_START=66 /DNA_END=1970 /DNA_ORIENTATION=+